MNRIDKPRIGVSSCLLGNAVRYDGTDKHCAYIEDSLGEVFSLQAFCPEMAIGLGVPRAPIQLVTMNETIHLRGVDEPKRDVTQDMQAYRKSISSELGQLSGYIFKARSPSCGLMDAPLHLEDGSLTVMRTSGLFARAIQELLPNLPLSNEEDLLDEERRNDFILRVINHSKISK